MAMCSLLPMSKHGYSGCRLSREAEAKQILRADT